MKKMNKFFITGLVVGLVAFSAALAVPTQTADAATTLVKQIRQTNRDAPPHQISALQANCNSDEILTGGGGAITGSLSSDVKIVATRPFQNSWQVYAHNPSGQTSSLSAFAVCTHLEQGQ
jgi:hypothetical protein